MELGRINVVLSRSNCCYSSGDLLDGRLEIELPLPKKVKSIYIKFNGDGGVRFKNAMVISNTGKTQTVLSYADEKYIYYKHECLKNSGNTGILARGKHIYPFSYHLPHDLPSTFQHEYGTIRYFLKIVLEQSRGFKQRSFKDFYVKSYLDLSLYPTLQECHAAMLTKKSLFFWVNSVKLKINVKLAKTGYSVGESILIYTEVINNTDRDVLDVAFELQRTLQFYAHAPKKDSKTVTAILAKTNLGLQPARCGQIFNPHLKVPEFRHETLDGSKIINVKYNLQVSAVLSSDERIVDKIPLSIGVFRRNQ